MKVQSSTVFAVFCTIAVLAALVAGWLFVGSPSEARLARFDARRASDLATISRTVTSYRLTSEALPQTLGDLQRAQPTAGLSFKDPAGQAYEYKVKDAFAYELCASFDTAAETTEPSVRPYSVFEKHGLGRQCFSLEARPASRR